MLQTVAAAGDFNGLEGAPFAPFFIALCCGVSLIGVFCLCRLLFGSRRPWRRRNPWHLIGVLAAAPFGVMTFQFFREIHIQNRRQSGTEFVFVLPPMASEYVKLHPDKIHRTGSDEECKLEGFTEWFRTTVAERKRNWPEVLKSFSYRGDTILDPQGVPVSYACDFNLDGVIDFRGQHLQIITRGDPISYKFMLVVIWHPNSPDEHVPIHCY